MLSPRISTTMEDIQNQRDQTDSITSHGYFRGHKCCLSKTKISGSEIKCSRLRRFILDLTSVQMADIRARRLYRSYAEMCAEKYRQYKFHPYSIHPYSKLRVWLEVFFTVAMVTTNVLMAVHYSATRPTENIYREYALRFLDIVYTLNIVIEFFTGYIKGYSCNTVVLDLKQILMKYSSTWLSVDLASISCVFQSLFDNDNIILELILASMRVLRISKLYIYIMNLLVLIQAGVAKELVAKVTFFLISYLTWNMYFQYALEYIVEETYVPVKPRNCSWITIGKLWNHTSKVRFIYAFDRAVGMLRGNANLNLIEEHGCFETFFMISWLISRVSYFPLVFRTFCSFIKEMFGFWAQYLHNLYRGNK